MYVQKHISFRIIVQFAWRNLLVFITLSTGVYYMHTHLRIPLGISFLPLGTIGTAVAITLGFRNNSAYERFWEARTLWGGLVYQSRIFSRQLLSVYIPPGAPLETERNLLDLHRSFMYRQIAFAHALRMHLRREELTNSACWTQLGPLLSADELTILQQAINKPNCLLNLQSMAYAKVNDSQESSLFRQIQLETILAEFTQLQGKCERIKNTPLPRQYAFFTKVFVWIFVGLIPFGLVGELGWLTIPTSVLLSWIFVTLEQVGDYTENPFEGGINDVPMSALCQTIEMEGKEWLGEANLPKALQPTDGILL
ncbi:bestrophin family protein [Spirosoma flavum]|uniref:Bestrophin family protein n=1 Tax=Spirosoma flavum TaxID=2048557 RepID=A0ABW6ALG4_9BACT